MNKVELIIKEKKDCRNYLRSLYEKLKQANANDANDKTKRSINNEIEATIKISEILTSLQAAYESGTGEEELAKLTQENDEEYNSLMILCKNANPRNYTQKYFRIKKLKESLDNINEKFLSEIEIYEYLRNYNEVMQLANENIYTSIYDIFMRYMEQTNQKENANYNYYMNMVKIHILFTNAAIATNIKDTDFALAEQQDSKTSSTDIKGDLSFLSDCFISPKDSPKFLKTTVFDNIRNAFCNKGNLDLYKISTDCNNIFIEIKNAKPIPFRMKININELFSMIFNISSHSHHLSSFHVKNQEELDVSKLGQGYKECLEELKKIEMTRIELPKENDDRKVNFDEIDDTKVVFEPNNMLSILKKYGIVIEKDYQLSELSKKIFYEKFKLFDQYIQQMQLYVVPILTNYIQNGVFKNQFLLFENAVNFAYIFDGNNTMRIILADMANDFDDSINNGKTKKGKKSVFDHLPKEINYEKSLLMYIFDDAERKNINDVLLLKYVLCVMNKEESIFIGGVEYSTHHICDALIHGRYNCHTENGETYYTMYDDEETLTEPNKLYWTATFKYSDLEKACLDIVTQYAKKSASKGI